MTRLYDESAEDLLRFFARRTGDPQVAFDLVGETFAEAVAGRDSFRGTTVEEGRRWLFGIGRNLMNNYFRRGYTEQRAMQKLRFEPAELSHHDFAQIEELAQLAEVRDAVRAAVSRLKPEYREAVTARIIEQREYAEIADETGASEDVVRARVSRGLKKLKNELERIAEEGSGSDV